MKRACSPETCPEHELKKGIPLNGQRPALSSLNAPVSPPRKRSSIKLVKDGDGGDTIPLSAPRPNTSPSLAAIEAGHVEVTDHLSTISARLKECVRPLPEQPIPRLPIKDWIELYKRNEHPEGRHFVIHQHDHPIAGPHYDLRLQFSETSSVSWSVMYGMPGDPNSQRLNRNATETRIHCLWNHLIETASQQTGSLIIWDTGEYEILPYLMDPSGPETDDSRSEMSEDSQVSPEEPISDSAKLRQAFQNRKIRLRLHGSRLPKDYTITLRMDKTTDFARPIREGRKRRRRHPSRPAVPQAPSTSDSESSSPPPGKEELRGKHADADDTDTADIEIQRNNAYPGSTNTIGSIHQRRWFLSLDRESSGFEPTTVNQSEGLKERGKKRTWTRKPAGGFEPFYVHGPEAERSIVTARLARDVLDDEAVEEFVPRRGWRPVLH
ncbi:hypothetical protein N7489_009158 [Penicillium chrysogenum]|uniref:DNA ligase D 3'-phosphoesterase domain-containing protein n=1 Tax=Penicillium chrysogenum TaxID=5076 RepID=A0ABQ8WYC0_PENCH|nr:uncharacterized protein N7489_009158 [Penicillium chrysogenum]KAJ5228450.1 hypothetical protein N7489_009158 [Penicillium chrysogenum]KAJ5257850.1 hypothetical protein N7524_009406 [Penicillium chrysogenum]KAJ5283916.1 hypothetical protein N7505_001896 [Penicillium chrysogenum]